MIAVFPIVLYHSSIYNGLPNVRIKNQKIEKTSFMA